MSNLFKHYAAFVAMLMLLASTIANAEKTAEAKVEAEKIDSNPHQVVEHVTEKLMKVVANGKQVLEENPTQYFSDVRVIMESSVDFKYIARNVMGAKYWKAASAEQKTQFIEVFTNGLVETYAKGMANFADLEITVQKPDVEIGAKRKVEVIQKVKGPKGVNRVSYTMGKHRSGEWKLINVVLDGVNLGKTLRAQFSQSVAESDGDLDAAISGWTWKG